MTGPRRRRAAAAVEFAMVAPILALMMLATWDLTTYIRAYFRVERVAAEVTNLTGQYERLRQADINQLFDAAQQIAGAIEVTQLSGRTIISAVQGTTQGNRMVWQRATIGGPGGLFESRIGQPPNIVTLPANMLVPVGQTVVITEVFNRRVPWVLSVNLLGAGAPETIYAFYIMRPRSAQLAEILP
jgi:Flp pilus assembly protein TadG